MDGHERPSAIRLYEIVSPGFISRDFDFGHQLLQLAWPACQHRERSEVHGNHGFRFKEFAGISSFARAHRVVIADWNHGNLWRVKFVDDPHIAENVGVARVIDLYAIGELDDVAAGLTAIDDLIAVFNSAGMVSVNHGHFDVADGLRSALIHLREYASRLFSPAIRTTREYQRLGDGASWRFRPRLQCDRNGRGCRA